MTVGIRMTWAGAFWQGGGQGLLFSKFRVHQKQDCWLILLGASLFVFMSQMSAEDMSSKVGTGPV